MRIFFAYLRRKARTLCMLALLFGLGLAVFRLYDLPPEAAVYGLVLCVFVGAVFFAVDFSRYVRRHRRLQELGASIALGVLPEPEDLLEEDYQALMETLRRDAARREEEHARRARETADYYTLWAHQIKTPIAAMDLMLQGEAAPEPADLREQLQRIEQYVEMVLGYLRMEDGSDLVLGTYDLDGIVRPAVKKFAAQFIRRGLRLRYEPLETAALTDEKWLRFVVEQVLSNALKYTPAGEISISMEPGKTLVIRDTGIGIRAEDLPRIFEKGYTGYNGREEGRSTGIGLYLCRRVCHMLGHTIAVESAPGEGTAVRLGLADGTLETE